MSDNDFYTDTLIDRSIVRRADEGKKLIIDGVATLFKVTSADSNDQLGVYEITMDPGKAGAKLHYHRFMDEIFIVMKGTLTIMLHEREEKVTAGCVAYVPRFTPHGFRNDSEEMVKLMLLFNPAQKREGFFEGLYEVMRENPVDHDKFLKLYQKYDSHPVGNTNTFDL